MNFFSGRTVLFYTTALVMFATSINVNADRLSGGERRFLRSDQIDDPEGKAGKELQMIIAPKEIDVDPLSTYNDKFMALMNSPCRPEYDGFFGATSGDPIRVQYGFKVEVQPLSAIMDILDAIEDKIVDSILQSSFPGMCGLHRTENPNRSLVQNNGHPSGFRFLKFDEVEKCLPQENEVNFCGMFTGSVYVYGKNQNEEETSRVIMSYINGVLESSEPSDLHSELTLLSRVDTFPQAKAGHTNQSVDSTSYTGGRLSRLDILLIIISGLIVAAVIYYIYIQRYERRCRNSKFPVGNTGDLSSDDVNFEGNDDSEDNFLEEDLQCKPYRDGMKRSAVFH